MGRFLSIRTIQIAVFVFVVAAAVVNEAHADALVVTQAMRASTIVEIYIDEKQIRAEFEIGAADLAAFEDVLPEKIYAKITGKTKPVDERLRSFFQSQWVIQRDGKPLLGKLERLIPAKRIVRDNVTGQALTDQPDDAEQVIRLTVSYALQDRPPSLTIKFPQKKKPTAASIGFVCYHNGLPINDFRYFPGEVTIDLDWTDPWYSRFHNPVLRRRYDAPLSAYLYIEPFEVRHEIIVRPKDMTHWLDLGLRDDDVIPVDQQQDLKQRIADFLLKKNPVFIDGKKVKGRLDRIHFILRTLRSTGIIEPPVDLDATSATLGVIFVYPVDKLPQQVSMTWELFSPKIQLIPAVASDEAGGLPGEVTPADPVLKWKNYLINPTDPEMVKVSRPPPPARFTVPVLSVICAVTWIAMLIAIGKQWRNGRQLSRPLMVMSLVLCVATVATLPFAKLDVVNRFSRPAILSENAANELVAGLLYNVYRSFDHHDESLIYDRLATSIDGELLSDVYLETRKSMEVKNQGGLRISVKDVIVKDLETVPESAAAPTFRCRWQVSGWIGHWGHVHARANEHTALITIAPREGKWKITSLEMLDEQSLDLPSGARPVDGGDGA